MNETSPSNKMKNSSNDDVKNDETTMQIPTTISTTKISNVEDAMDSANECKHNDSDEVHHNDEGEDAAMYHQIDALLKSINFASSIACMNSQMYHDSFLQITKTKTTTTTTTGANGKLSTSIEHENNKKTCNEASKSAPPPSPMLQPSFEDFHYNLYSNNHKNVNNLHQNNNTINTNTYQNSNPTQNHNQNFSIEQELRLHSFMETQTSLPKLISSIHRLQSNLYHLSSESDLDTNEVSTLHSQVQHYKSQYTKYKKFSKKIWKLNCQLKEEMEKSKHDHKLLIKSMKKFYKQKKMEDRDKEERIIATQSFIHENMMKLKQKQAQQQLQQQKISTASSNEDQSSQTMMGNRRRTFTQESNVSEFEDFDLDCFYFGSSNNNNGASYNHGSIGSLQSQSQLEDLALSTPKQQYEEDFLHGDPNANLSYDPNNIDGRNGFYYPNAYHRNSNDDYLNTPGSSDNMSLVSSSSSRSLITDENLPTLRLETYNTCVPLPSFNESSNENTHVPMKNDNGNPEDSCSNGDTNSSVGVGISHCNSTSTNTSTIHKSKRAPLTYTLTFQIGSEVGLQFQEMDLIEPSNNNTVTQDSNQAGTTSNRQRTFSGGRKVATTSINTEESKAKKPTNSNIFENFFNSFDYDQFQKPAPYKMKKIIPANPKVGKSGEHPTTINMSNSQNSIEDSEQNKQTAIIVYDFQGFDTSTNVRPTLGARLIAINGESLLDTSSNEKWTVDRVIEHISNFKNDETVDNKADSDSKLPNEKTTENKEKKTFTLTFRNDILSKCQKEELQRKTKTRPNMEKDCIPKSEDEDSSGSSGSVVNVHSGDQDSGVIPDKEMHKPTPLFESPPRVLGKLGKKINLHKKSPTRGIEKLFDKLKSNESNIASSQAGDDEATNSPKLVQSLSSNSANQKAPGMDKFFSIFNGGIPSNESSKEKKTLSLHMKKVMPK